MIQMLPHLYSNVSPVRPLQWSSNQWNATVMFFLTRLNVQGTSQPGNKVTSYCTAKETVQYSIYKGNLGMIELLQNRSQRLQFEVSSPNGILLFREASSMLVTYGQSILEITKNNILSQERFLTVRTLKVSYKTSRVLGQQVLNPIRI